MIRIGTLLSLLPLARGIHARRRPLLAGAVLTVVGVVFRTDIVGGVVLLPGIVLLLCSPLMPGPAPQTELERELGSYVTRAQRFDLEARLDQYPDDVTQELRDILASCR